MASDREKREQGKSQVSIDDLPEAVGATSDDADAVKGGLMPRGGGGGTWTDPDSGGEIWSGE